MNSTYAYWKILTLYLVHSCMPYVTIECEEEFKWPDYEHRNSNHS